MERTGSARDSTEDARADRSDTSEGVSARRGPGILGERTARAAPFDALVSAFEAVAADVSDGDVTY